MKVSIKIEWGGWIAYVDANRNQYTWDGGLEVENGRLLSISRREIRTLGHGVREERRHPMTRPTWKSVTTSWPTRGLDGVALEVEGDAKTRIVIRTAMADFAFKLGKILRKKYSRQAVGDKYSGLSIAAMLEGAGPFAMGVPIARGCLDIPLSRDDFKGATRYALWQMEPAAWLAPGETATAKLHLPRAPYRDKTRHSVMTLELRLSLAKNFEEHALADSRYASFCLAINDQALPVAPTAFRTDSGVFKVQRLEFVQIVLPDKTSRKGENVLKLTWPEKENYLIVVSARLFEEIRTHGKIASYPEWLNAGETFDATVFAATETPGAIESVGATPIVPFNGVFKAGMTTIRFRANADVGAVIVNVRMGDATDKVVIPVYPASTEKNKWQVGGSFQTVKHDDSGEVERAIRYMKATRMGNHVMFRVEPDADRGLALKAPLERWKRWAELCEDLDMDFSVNGHHAFRGRRGLAPNEPLLLMYDILETLKRRAAKNFFSVHIHEFCHWFYCYMPGAREPLHGPDWTMADARNSYVADSAAIETIAGVPRQSGQATAMAAYDRESGFDHIAVETMALNASHLNASAAGAVRAMGGRWGNYDATYWAKVPNDFTKLAASYINYYLTYLWGGDFAISEDGHFEDSQSGFQQGFDGEGPAALRQILREFYRYVNTHPRRGTRVTPIAVAQGNLSAETFSFPPEFIGAERAIRQVWGSKGGLEDKWRYADPERGALLLDVFMPWRRDSQNIRHWFTGTPYGAFDIAPIWAVPDAVLSGYKFLAFVGWNTMTPAIYAKLRTFVANGGTLFMTLPQLSGHNDREFLSSMTDLALVHDGDFSDLFGARVLGRRPEKGFAATFTGDESARADFPWWKTYAGRVGFGDIENRGAAVALTDKNSGAPILLENALGKGKAYFLNAWAFPGNASLEELCRDVLAWLAERNRGDIHVEDFSNEVAWSVWRDETFAEVCLLNTDWTQLDNVKNCRVFFGDFVISAPVRERRFATIAYDGNIAFVSGPGLTRMESRESANDREAVYRLRGWGPSEIRFYSRRGVPRQIELNGVASAPVLDAADEAMVLKTDIRDDSGVQLRICF